MDFVSWFKGGIAELTPDDIASCDKDLNLKFDDEKQLGTVDGDLLKLWAFICKDVRSIRRDLVAHEKAHKNSEEHTDACRTNAQNLLNRTERNRLLTRVFWNDVREQLGDKEARILELRRGMVIVEGEQYDLDTILVRLSSLRF